MVSSLPCWQWTCDLGCRVSSSGLGFLRFTGNHPVLVSTRGLDELDNPAISRHLQRRLLAGRFETQGPQSRSCEDRNHTNPNNEVHLSHTAHVRQPDNKIQAETEQQLRSQFPKSALSSPDNMHAGKPTTCNAAAVKLGTSKLPGNQPTEPSWYAGECQLASFPAQGLSLQP